MATLARAQSGNLTRWLVLLLGAAVFLNYVDRGAIAVAAPVMKGELGMSATAFGIAVSAFFWVYAPVQLVVGWLCDRFSVYRLMAGGIVLWAASTLLIGFVGGFSSLLVLRVMLGIGESIAFPGTSKIIAMNVPPEQRGMANAAVAAGLALGPAIGTLAGGLIVASFGWRAMFIIFGLATLLWLVPWQRVVRQLPTIAAGATLARVPARALLGNWSLWSMGIGHALGNFCFYFLLAWLPLYLVQSRGYSIGEMTILASVGYGVQAVAAMAYGTISDRWTRSGRSEATIRRAMMIVSQLLAGVAIFGIYT
ncbi:MAG: MFS transporter, partial [Sphingomicrobium sp.]